MSKTSQTAPPRSVLVTGGTGFLGSAVVLAHLERGDSCTVSYLLDHEQERLTRQVAEELGSEGLERLQMVHCQLTDPVAVKQLVEAATQRFGIPTVADLIAGGWAGGTNLGEAPADQWTQMAEMNTTTLWNVLQTLLPGMAEAGEGSIVAVGSRAALEGGPGSAAYAASKAAVVSLVTSLAAEYLDQGIRANCVLPSTIDTPANRKAMPEADASAWVPLEELTETILWLHSPIARSISGAALPVYNRA